MHISELTVGYLKPKEFGCLVSKPVYDEETSEFYFSYEGYVICLFINVEVKDINGELCIVISSVENNTYESDCDKISEKDFLSSLISDVFYLKELVNQFPLNLKYVLKNTGDVS